MIDVQEAAIPCVKIITPEGRCDDRGSFSETYNRRALAQSGVRVDFVQDNHSHSLRAYTLRGLHFQAPRDTQAKLVRVTRGAVLDVAVDLRHGSPSFARHVMIELSAENQRQLLVPRGFAHGFLTLVPNTEVIYKVDAYYAPEHDRGVRFDDADLAIPWPLPPAGPILSDKDRCLPALAELPVYFRVSPVS